MQQRQEGWGRGRGRGVSVNNRQGSAERSRWQSRGDASSKIPRQVGVDTIQRLPSRWGSLQDGSRKNTQRRHTTLFMYKSNINNNDYHNNYKNRGNKTIVCTNVSATFWRQLVFL